MASLNKKIIVLTYILLLITSTITTTKTNERNITSIYNINGKDSTKLGISGLDKYNFEKINQTKTGALPNSAIIIAGIPTISSKIAIGNFVGDDKIEASVLSSSIELVICDYRGLKENITFSWTAMKDPIAIDIDGDNYEELFIATSGGYLVLPDFPDVAISISNIQYGNIIGADIDGDGVDEAIIENDNNIILVENDLTSTTLYTTNGEMKYLVPANIDSDPEIEILAYELDKTVLIDYPNSIEIWDNTSSKVKPAIGNFDSDPMNEIVKVWNKSIYIVDNNGAIIWSIGNIAVSSLQLGDMNGDNIDEIYALSSGSLYRIEVGKSPELIGFNFMTLPVFYDFNNDGEDEGLAIEGNLKLFFYNNSFITLFPKNLTTISRKPRLADLDGDGLPEFLIIQQYWGERKLMVYKLFPKVEVPKPIGGGPSKIKYEINRYHNYSEIVDIALKLNHTYFNRVDVFYIGKSYSLKGDISLNIIAIKITNGNGEKKPSLLILGAHHARELITAEAAIYLAVNLTEQYGYDPYITTILDNFDIYIVPVVNPGGHDYALLYNDWQRKNLRPVDDDGDGRVDEDPPEDVNNNGLIEYIYDGATWILEGYDNDGDGVNGEDPPGGVDLNRNYNYSWTNQGMYGIPWSDTYSGPSPLSEPETRAVDLLMRSIMPILALSLHSGEETVFYPWGTGYRIPFEYDLITELANIAQISSGFAAMQSSSIYEANGVWDDHAYGYYGILSFTPEIFTNESWPIFNGNKYYGIKWMFNPFPSKILEVNKKVLNMFIALAAKTIDIINDNTPPTIKQIYFETTKDKELTVNVKAIDPESGIHYINITINYGNKEITKLMIHNKDTDAWFTKLKKLGEIEIEVVNRAGLKIITKLNIIIIKAPANNSIVKGEFKLEWNVSSSLPVDYFNIYANNTLIASDIPRNYTSYTINLNEGHYTLTIEAVLTNNIRVNTSINIIVDPIPPEFTYISIQNNTIVREKTINISWNAEDNYGIDHYEININHTKWINIGTETSYPVNFNSSGLYNIVIKAVDLVNNNKTILIKIRVNLEGGEGNIYIVVGITSIIAIISITLALNYFRRKRK